jgi:hypothetical protein
LKYFTGRQKLPQNREMSTVEAQPPNRVAFEKRLDNINKRLAELEKCRCLLLGNDHRSNYSNGSVEQQQQQQQNGSTNTTNPSDRGVLCETRCQIAEVRNRRRAHRQEWLTLTPDLEQLRRDAEEKVFL